jgi:hypothetical protein
MSYGFKVSMVNGELSVECACPQYLPVDAVWVISGHEDEANRQVGVSRLDALGRMQVLASAATQPIHAPAEPVPAPPAAEPEPMPDASEPSGDTTA